MERLHFLVFVVGVFCNKKNPTLTMANFFRQTSNLTLNGYFLQIFFADLRSKGYPTRPNGIPMSILYVY